jgi:hypothetical protein
MAEPKITIPWGIPWLTDGVDAMWWRFFDGHETVNRKTCKLSCLLQKILLNRRCDESVTSYEIYL